MIEWVEAAVIITVVVSFTTIRVTTIMQKKWNKKR